MQVIAEYGKEDLATVYVARVDDDEAKLIEFVESVQPPIPREQKWVLIISTLFGCPVRCAFCDAGGGYAGALSADQILDQILFMVNRRYPGGVVAVPKLKIQFARMGEPALNPAVLEALRRLPERLRAPGLLPSISSVGPWGREAFFEELLQIKEQLYGGGRFQLQFSIHSTDPSVRRHLIPIRLLSLPWIADFGSRFRRADDQLITLNFAVARDVPLDPPSLRSLFSPEHFLIKLTPVNPTARAKALGIESGIDPFLQDTGRALKQSFEEEGFRVILSIGEVEENAIGSNCGMFVSEIREGRRYVREGYTSQRFARLGARIL